MDRDELIATLLLCVLVPFPFNWICVFIDIKTHYFTDLLRKLFHK